jgi:hypothetical protein
LRFGFLLFFVRLGFDLSVARRFIPIPSEVRTRRMAARATLGHFRDLAVQYRSLFKCTLALQVANISPASHHFFNSFHS